MSQQPPRSTQHVGLDMHLGFLENRFEGFLYKHFLLRRATRSVEKHMRQCARPEERTDLR